MLSQSLIKEADKRIYEVLKNKKTLSSTLCFEIVYDALRSLCDAHLARSGFKSYSHEASIAYLKEVKIPEIIVEQLDTFRKKRNQSKYYAAEISSTDLKRILSFIKRYRKKII